MRANTASSQPVQAQTGTSVSPGSHHRPRPAAVEGRRGVLATLIASGVWVVQPPRQAEALEMESIYEALPGLYSSPSPVLVPRRTFADTAFAVALLRSGYETVDELDCYPMDTWQKEFWLRRRSEWESYRSQNEPLRIEQGDLANPLYFDFIAAMQFATVDKSLREPKQRFKEFCGEEECGEDQYRIVTRDGLYSDDARLPEFFAEKFGERLYGKLVGLASPLQVPAAETPLALATALEDYFVSQGFALKSEVREREDGTLVIKTTGAATLWALQYCTSRRSKALPMYDCAVLQYLLREKLGRRSSVRLVELSERFVVTEVAVGNSEL